MPELREWESFYVIVGSSAGALIGLQFVVMTLVAERPPERVAEGSAAFASPTVIHFGAVLLVAALICAPFSEATAPSLAWGLVGLCGLVYSVVVALRMRRQTAYRPQVDDWVFFALLPTLGYLLLAASAIAASSHLHGALFGVGGAALLLLLVGIRNTWDSVLWHVVTKSKERPEA
jgi:hypothetical protein